MSHDGPQDAIGQSVRGRRRAPRPSLKALTVVVWEVDGNKSISQTIACLEGAAPHAKIALNLQSDNPE